MHADVLNMKNVHLSDCPDLFPLLSSNQKGSESHLYWERQVCPQCEEGRRGQWGDGRIPGGSFIFRNKMFKLWEGAGELWT